MSYSKLRTEFPSTKHMREALRDRIKDFSPSDAAKTYTFEKEYRLTSWQKNHMKVIRSMRDWDRVKGKFLEAVQATQLITFDTESYSGTKSLSLLLVGSFVGPFIVLDLDKLWPSGRRHYDLQDFLPKELVEILRDSKVMLVGSDVQGDYQKIFPGESAEWFRWVEIGHIANMLVEAGKLGDLGKKHGMGNIAFQLFQYDYKAYMEKVFCARYPNTIWRWWRAPTTMYKWRDRLTFYQKFYIFFDIAVPLILTMMLLDLFLEHNNKYEVTDITPRLMHDIFGDLPGKCFNHQAVCKNLDYRMSTGALADSVAYVREEKMLERAQKEREARLAAATRRGPVNPGAPAGPSAAADDEDDDEVVLRPSSTDKILHDMLEHKRFLKEKAEWRRSFSGLGCLKGRPRHHATSKQPIFGRVCWQCGKSQKGCSENHHKLKCGYPMCYPENDLTPHDISMCRSLQSICNKCFLRGHREKQCGNDGFTAEKKEERRKLFEEHADHGMLTKDRWTNPYIGAFYFGRNGFKKVKKLNLTYWQMTHMTVEAVQRWIREYKFEAHEKHEARMFTSKKRDLWTGKIMKRPKPDRRVKTLWKSQYKSSYKRNY